MRSKSRNSRSRSVQTLELRRLFAGDVATPVIADVSRLPGANGEYSFQLSGTADGNNRVVISQTGIGELGHAIANENGEWIFDVVQAQLAESKFEFVATAIDVDGDLSSPSETSSFQPNILLINTDDTRKDQLQFMPFLQSLAENATSFQNAFAPTAVSGPSRAALLSGLVVSNNGILGNTPTMGSGLNFDYSATLATWMSDAGYRTGLFGKDRTLPGADAQYESQDVFAVPPGWDTYFAGVGGGAIGFNVSFTDNGELVRFGHELHTTDILRDRVIDFVDTSEDDAPFFAYLSTNAPHAPGTPPARYDHVLDGVTLPEPPSFLLGDSVPSEELLSRWEQWYREGSESLMGVDEAIEKIYEDLEQSGELDNSIIIFTSDNGVSFGEHALFGKNRFWEETIRVPLMIWDGRAQMGQSTDSLATTVDVTGTIIDLAGAETTKEIDGRSLVPILSQSADVVRDDFLIEHYSSLPGRDTYVEYGVRNSDWVYAESELAYNGENEFLFNLVEDPFQLNNLKDDPASLSQKEALRQRLDELRPADRETPEVSQFSWQATGGNYDQPQDLRLTFLVDDTETGGSEIRTSAISFSADTAFGSAFAAEPIDGAFGGISEVLGYTIGIQDLAQAHDSSTLYVTARDISGNFGEPIAVAIPTDETVDLISNNGVDATGDHGLVVAGISTFGGQASPGDRVALFSAFGNGEFVLKGTSVAGEDGKWSVDATFDTAGEHTVYAQAIAADSALDQDVSFLVPINIRVLAALNGNRIDVQGSLFDDHIIVEAAENGDWRFTMNDIVVGTLPPANSVYINGNRGDDILEVRGSIPSRLFGWMGDDILIGGSGNDTLIGGIGENHLYGNEGNDFYSFEFSDQVMVVDISATQTKDYIHEIAGEGTDRVNVTGSLEVVADLTSDVGPQLSLSATLFEYRRSVYFDEVRAIERFGSKGPLSQWTVDNHSSVLPNVGNDTVIRSDKVKHGDLVDLKPLTIGKDAVFAGNVRTAFSAAIGEFTLPAELPSDVLVISSGNSLLELQGPIDEINALIDRGDIQLMVGRLNPDQTTSIKVVTYPVDSPSFVQRDTMAIRGDNRLGIGLYRDGHFLLDVTRDQILDLEQGDISVAFGAAGAIPVVGDWNGDGDDDLGLYVGNEFRLDSNDDGIWDPDVDFTYVFGRAGHMPVIGDWNGDGIDDIGVHHGNAFWLDADGSGGWEVSKDKFLRFGRRGVTPVVGDWNGDGIDQIGVFAKGVFWLDKSDDGRWDIREDLFFRFGPHGTPIVGDWNQDGIDDVGVHITTLFLIDSNVNGRYDEEDEVIDMGLLGDVPLIGNWEFLP